MFASARYRFAPIDVQYEFVRDLSEQRQQSFPWAVRATADRLEQELQIPSSPIVYIQYGAEFHVCKNELTDNPEAVLKRRAYMQRSGLMAWAERPQDDLFVKGHENAFSRDRLLPHHGDPLDANLKDHSVMTLLVGGMNSSSCVKDTVEAATWLGFSCIVFTDLLADSSPSHHEGAYKGDPDWHERLVKKGLDAASKVAFATTEQFFRDPQRYLKPVRTAARHGWRRACMTIGIGN